MATRSARAPWVFPDVGMPTVISAKFTRWPQYFPRKVIVFENQQRVAGIEKREVGVHELLINGGAWLFLKHRRGRLSSTRGICHWFVNFTHNMNEERLGK